MKTFSLFTLLMVGLFSFSSHAVAALNLEGHWDFEEAVGTTPADSSGNGNTGAFVGSPVISTTHAPIDSVRGLQFNSSDDAVEIANSPSLEDWNNGYSYSIWFKRDETGTGEHGLMTNSDSIALAIVSNKIFFWAPGNDIVESTSSVNDTDWHHVVGVFDNNANTMKIYLDGILDVTATNYTATPTTPTRNFIIGNEAEHTDRAFSGYLDEALVYTGALSQEQVTSLYGGTIPPTIEFISPTPDDASSQATYPEVSLLTADSTNGHYSFTDFDNSLIGWYKFDNETADDSSPTMFHGILQNGSYTASGKFGGAAVFNGTSTYVDTLLPSSVSDHYTMSVWVKLNNPTWSGALVSDANGHLLQIGGSNVWQFNGAYGTATADTGVWTHLVGVYNGGQEILYVNGTVAATSWGNRSMDQHINIGRRMDGFYIDGQIDDVVFFDRALGADEVASLYDATETQYDHFFINTSSGEHTFTGYVADMDGNIATTEERTVTLTAPTLTEVTPIPSQVRASRAKYYFSVDGDIEDYDYLAENCGDIETIVDPINHIVSFGGLKSGHEYGNCSFGMYSSTGPATNALYIGAFTITPEPASVVGGHALETIAPAPILSNTNLCPTDQILTFPVNIKKLQTHLVRLGFTVGPIDGISGPMTKAAIKQAQTKLGTLADGLVGPLTRNLINNSCTK